MIKILTSGKIEEYVLDYLREHLAEIFGLNVSQDSIQGFSENAFNRKRGQYLASAILEEFRKFKKGKSEKILILIDEDLYEEGLNFVFGEADPLNGIGIISLVRLRQSYYNLPQDKNLFLERTLKEAVHEIGHLLYLRHCPNSKCVMHFSNLLQDTDKKDYYFCGNCKKLLSLEK